MMRALLAAALFAATLGGARRRKAPLRVSLNTELQVLDPIVATINATRVFAYWCSTSWSASTTGNYHPQMLEGWEVADDRLS